MKIIASNFKTNHTRKTTKTFVEDVNQFLQTNNINNDVYIFPTSTALDQFELSSNLFIGVQNAYPTQNGSFTGELGMEQLDEFGIKTILIGHSERRHILGESQKSCVEKFNFYKELGYTIIYCIGEKLEVKEQGVQKTLEYCFDQLEGIDINYENLIIAYEPVWAIGTGVVATVEDITIIHNALKEKISVPILYGGSVKPANLAEILDISTVDGSLIGTSSWDVEAFKQMIEITSKK
jgi:triosephosphate isomerase (TIM)